MHSVLIWDCDEKIPEWKGPVFLWRSFDESTFKGSRSIPNILEKESEQWRNKFLALIYEFGNKQTDSKSIVEWLEIEEGFSYWWLSLVAQKDIIQYSKHLYDILKLLVAEDQLRTMPSEISSIRIKSDNEELIVVFRNWAQSNSYHFSVEKVRSKRFTQRLFSYLPLWFEIFLKGQVVLFKFVLQRISLRPKEIPQGLNNITFFDVFTHLNSCSFETGHFKSNYWTILIDFLKKESISANWFHWFFKHKFVKTIPAATKLAASFDKADPAMYHIIGDSRISINQCYRVFLLFCRINRMSWQIKNKKEKSIVSGSVMNFWPILKKDWYESFFGARSYLNLFSIIVVKDFIKKLPKQTLGFYIQENQPWEYAICYYWKKYNHGKLVGVAHTTIPFWDFRYFYDPRTFQPFGCIPPLPDLMAVNGNDAYQKMTYSGFPSHKLVELEALRYMHLNDTKEKIKTDGNNLLRLLVLGDLVPEITNNQLSFLNNVIECYNLKIEIIFKPHPASNETIDALVKNMEVSYRSMGEELQECDVVFVNNVTSGAADPYQMGIPVIVLNLGTNINFSPLFSRKDVFFVSTAEEFYSAFIYYKKKPKLVQPDFFNTDSSLPKWKSLFSSVGACP